MRWIWQTSSIFKIYNAQSKKAFVGQQSSIYPWATRLFRLRASPCYTNRARFGLTLIVTGLITWLFTSLKLAGKRARTWSKLIHEICHGSTYSTCSCLLSASWLFTAFCACDFIPSHVLSQSINGSYQAKQQIRHQPWSKMCKPPWVASSMLRSCSTFATVKKSSWKLPWSSSFERTLGLVKFVKPDSVFAFFRVKLKDGCIYDLTKGRFILNPPWNGRVLPGLSFWFVFVGSKHHSMEEHQQLQLRIEFRVP